MTAIGAMTAAPWTQPPTWHVPREWNGGSCFILCSGESIGPQQDAIRKIEGRFIAVKHGVYVKPDADVLFVSGDGVPDTLPLLKAFKGTHRVVRTRSYPEFDAYNVKRVTRSKDHRTLCELRDHVSGRDSGTSAINLAYHFGATEIVLLGYDMRGGHFCKHPLQNPPQDHFVRHCEFLDALNADAKRKGIRIVNCSPISAVTAFEKGLLEDWL